MIPAMAALLGATAVPAAATTHVVSDVGQLQYWAAACNPGDEIVINAGLYVMTKRLYMLNKAGVTIRGATGSAEDVILRGPGMNNPDASFYEGMDFASPDMTIKDLTVEEYYHHAIHYHDAGDRCVLDNVTTRNIGCQHIKGARYTDDCVIRDCLMEQTKVRENGLPGRPENYVGGIDLHGARRCRIYDNVAIDVNGLHGGDGGIFIWNYSSDCVIERNVVIGCRKGVELGNPSSSNPTSTTIVRNNFVLRKSGNDIGMEFCYTDDCQAYNNTVCSITQDNNFGRTVHIYGETEDLELTNNIIYGQIRAQAGGETGWTSTSNIIGTGVDPAWFVDFANGDFHLTELAAAAIDNALVLAEVTDDVDAGPRPAGVLPDIGADEYGSPVGDANYDGRVDGLDYGIWSVHYQQPGNWGDANFNGDVLVDGLDYNLWSLNYSFGSESGQPVPGPAATALLGLGAAALIARRRRRLRG